jgi:hypothetical protein
MYKEERREGAVGVRGSFFCFKKKNKKLKK